MNHGPTANPRWASARNLLLLSAAALVAFLVVYLLAVQTELGQRADEAALTGSQQAPERAQDAADKLLKVVSIGSLLAATAFLSALAWLRRRPGLLLIPAAVIGLSLIATEAFKLVIFERPDLVVDPGLVGNSYPSGHTTVAVAIGLAAVLIAPPRLRTPVAFGAASVAALAGVFVVTADWHRPSDPIGSYLLTLSVAAACMAALRLWLPARATRSHGLPQARADAARLELTAMFAGAALFVGALILASLRYGAEVDWNRFHAAFLLGSAVTVVTAGVVTAALLRALGAGAAGNPRQSRLASRPPSQERHESAADTRSIQERRADERGAFEDGRDGDGRAGRLGGGQPIGAGRGGDRTRRTGERRAQRRDPPAL